MFPNDQNQNNGQPQYPQPGPTGQYDVVPPLHATPGAGNHGHNPYEFIVAPAAPKRSTLSLGGGNAFFARIGLLVGGFVLILIVLGIILSSLLPKGSTPGLISIAQQQQEIVRIASDASTKATNAETKNFTASVSLSVASSQQQIIGYLANHGTKLKDKTLALNEDPKTDTLLTDAISAGTYDSVVTQNLASQLQTYEQLLQTTFKETNNKEAKQVLQSSYTSAAKLLAQAKHLTGSTE